MSLSLDWQDTIVAIASPPGPAHRGLVRLSGPKAHEIVLTGFRTDRPIARWKSSSWIEGSLDVEGLRLPAQVALWTAPRTYTGQDLAEVHTVGTPVILQALLGLYMGHGARLAERGEFTLRGFLSGRIDLTQAEAVLGVIEASNAGQLQAALQQLAGGLSRGIHAVRDRLLDLVAHLEAGLDFVDEEDVDPFSRPSLAAELDSTALEIERLAEQLHHRGRPEQVPKVVLVGPPNAGKSRLFNALLGWDRAIVSSQAGTTRDYLSSRLIFKDLEVELIDTAGIDPGATGDAIMERADRLRDEQAAVADLLLVCVPADDPSAILADRMIGQERDGRCLVVATKCDVAEAPAGLLGTSAVTGEGIEALKSRLASWLTHRNDPGDAVAITSARCQDSLRQAGQALRNASTTLAHQGGDELVALDLRLALDELGKVVGAVVTDDILDRIFSRFCIGK